MTRLLMFAPSALLMAQTGFDLPPWLQTAGFVTLIPLFVWMLYYDKRYAIPRIHKENQEHIEKISIQHATTVGTMNDKHAALVTTIVNEFRADNKEHRAACADEKKLLMQELRNIPRQRQTPQHHAPKVLPGDGTPAG